MSNNLRHKESRRIRANQKEKEQNMCHDSKRKPLGLRYGHDKDINKM